ELYRALHELQALRDTRPAGTRKNGGCPLGGEEGKPGSGAGSSALPHLHPSAPPPCPAPIPQSEIRNPQSPRPTVSPGVPSFASGEPILRNEPTAPAEHDAGNQLRCHY